LERRIIAKSAGGEVYTFKVAGLSDHCGICGQEFLYALPRCPICHKSVCDGCAKRMGGNTFCGTDCSHAFFFGGEEEIDESEVSRFEDGE
jgi:hypothetical protein